MSAGRIWWGQIGNSLRLLSQVAENLRDNRSVILRIPERFPWRERFYEQIDIRREGFSMDRRLQRVRWETGGDPGAFVLRELCPRKVQAEFWPGQTVGEYLGSRRDLALCGIDVWVQGLHSREDLIRWASFVAQYETAAQALDHRASFLLEYDGPSHASAAMPSIVYQVENCDCRVFCLEMAAERSEEPLRSYQAELALSIGGEDPEFCAALLEEGELLTRNPLEAVQEAIRERRASDGRRFPELSDSAAASAVWLAAVVLLFPALERFRIHFIARHEEEIAKFLPISNSNGDEVTEPFDLELGPLFYVVHSAGYAFSPAEVDRIILCRKVRNLLAHNKPVPYEDVRAVLEL